MSTTKAPKLSAKQQAAIEAFEQWQGKKLHVVKLHPPKRSEDRKFRRGANWFGVDAEVDDLTFADGSVERCTGIRGGHWGGHGYDDEGRDVIYVQFSSCRLIVRMQLRKA